MTITFAHRGGRADHPENTLRAFKRALAHGAIGLETDAWSSKDGEVVLVHDQNNWVKRAGFLPWKINVSKKTAKELASFEIPTLGELYSICGTDYELSIDCKEPRVAELIIKEAQARNAAEKLWLCDSSLTRLRYLREKYLGVHLVHSRSKRKISSTMERHAADLSAANITAMNMHHSEWTLGLVTLFHRFNIKVFAWDVQEVRNLRSMLAMGIDAVYSDHVDRMVSVVAEWR